MLQNPNSIHAQLKDANNYKFIVKAIASRDEGVLVTLLDLLLLLGDFEMFLESLTSAAFIEGIVKAYRSSQLRPIKVKALIVLNQLLRSSEPKKVDGVM